MPDTKTVVGMLIGATLASLFGTISPDVRAWWTSLNVNGWIVGFWLSIAGLGFFAIRWLGRILVIDRISILEKQGVELRQGLNDAMNKLPVLQNRLKALEDKDDVDV